MLGILYLLQYYYSPINIGNKKKNRIYRWKNKSGSYRTDKTTNEYRPYLNYYYYYYL